VSEFGHLSAGFLYFCETCSNSELKIFILNSVIETIYKPNQTV